MPDPYWLRSNRFILDLRDFFPMQACLFRLIVFIDIPMEVMKKGHTCLSIHVTTS